MAASSLPDKEKEIAALKKQLKDISGQTVDFKVTGISEANTAIRSLNALIKEATKKAEELEEGWGGIATSIQNSNAEMTKMSGASNIAIKNFSSLQSIAEKLKYNQQDIYKLNVEDLKKLQLKAVINQQEIKDQAKIIIAKHEANGLDATKLSLGANGKELNRAALASHAKKLGLSVRTLKNEQAIAIAAKDGFTIFDESNKLLDEEIKKREKIEKKLGLTGGLLKGLSAIPILGPLLKTEKALEAATKAAENGGSALGVMGAAAKSMGGSLLSSLTDPLVVVGFLVKAFKFLLDYALKANQTITDLGRSMGVSNEEATKLYKHFGEIANLSNETNTLGAANLITQQSLAEAYLQITKFAGATKGITDQQSKDQVFYNKKLQLSVEAQEGMFKLGSLNKMNGEAMLKTIIKQTGALSKQTGIQFDNKTVIEQVSKVSGQLSANYKNDPTLIAKAVVQANKLGLTLEKAAEASSKLLDFESSIQNELEAELLTGKDLNLEKARLLALNGDAAGAAAEMLAQVGSLSEFQNMNVLQQEALAKAVGMTANELANSLRQQENLNNLGDENKKQIEEAAEKLRESGDIIGANALLNQTANDAEALAALEKNSAQEAFNILVDKLKATFGEMASGPLMDLLNDFEVWSSKTENILALIDKIRMGFAALGAYMVGKFLFNIATMVGGFVTSAGAATATELAIKRSNTALIQSLVTQGALTAAQGAGAIASLTTASAGTLGIGIAPILAALGIAVAAFSTYMALKDGHIGSDGGLLVSGEKGSTQL